MSTRGPGTMGTHEYKPAYEPAYSSMEKRKVENSRNALPRSR